MHKISAILQREILIVDDIESSSSMAKARISGPKESSLCSTCIRTLHSLKSKRRQTEVCRHNPNGTRIATNNCGFGFG